MLANVTSVSEAMDSPVFDTLISGTITTATLKTVKNNIVDAFGEAAEDMILINNSGKSLCNHLSEDVILINSLKESFANNSYFCSADFNVTIENVPCLNILEYDGDQIKKLKRIACFNVSKSLHHFNKAYA